MRYLVSSDDIRRDRPIDYHNLTTAKEMHENILLDNSPRLKERDIYYTQKYSRTLLSVINRILDDGIENLKSYKSIFKILRNNSEDLYKTMEDKIVSFLKDIKKRRKER